MDSLDTLIDVLRSDQVIKALKIIRLDRVNIDAMEGDIDRMKRQYEELISLHTEHLDELSSYICDQCDLKPNKNALVGYDSAVRFLICGLTDRG